MKEEQTFINKIPGSDGNTELENAVRRVNNAKRLESFPDRVEASITSLMDLKEGLDKAIPNSGEDYQALLRWKVRTKNTVSALMKLI